MSNQRGPLGDGHGQIRVEAQAIPAPKPPTVFHPVQTHHREGTMPEDVVLRAYEVYCHVYGPQPEMVDVKAGCRGGFSLGELIAFLYARSFPKEQWIERMEAAFDRKPGSTNGR